MPTYVLGTHVSHNGSACLLRDGVVAFAIEKERITRRKHDGGLDNEAVQYCLDAEGIGIEDIDLVVQNANFDLFTGASRSHPGARRSVTGAKRVVAVSHHLAHAYSAIGAAPFDDAAVLVIDGCGNAYADCLDLDRAQVLGEPPTPELHQHYFEKDSYYLWDGGELSVAVKDFSPPGLRQDYHFQPASTMHSIGGAYLAASRYVFRGFEDPGKLMGLAPFGSPGRFDFEMFECRDGRVFVRYDWMDQFDRPAASHIQFQRDFQYYADIANQCQREVERAILYVVKSRRRMAPTSNLCFAGGVALNAVANRRIVLESGFEKVFFQPAAGDNGLALGCAYYGWLHVLGRRRRRPAKRSNFGKVYPASEIRAVVGSEPGIEVNTPKDVVESTAQRLAAGQTIAWFSGGSEFGPRALGHRSILADPGRAEVQREINATIKFREDFRPFAPAVPREDVETYFDHPYESPYMILVGRVREAWKAVIPAVVHVDGSARVQTVERDVSPNYHRLLKAFGAHTGYSVLLNTSLNRRGMPIVETPGQAIQLLKTTALDAVVFVDAGHVVTRKVGAGVEDVSVDAVFMQLRDLCTSAGAELRSLGKVIDFEVTGTSRRCSLDCERGSMTFRPALNPDITVSFSEAGLLDAFRDPQCIDSLVAHGHAKVLGLPANASLEQTREITASLGALFELIGGTGSFRAGGVR